MLGILMWYVFQKQHAFERRDHSGAVLYEGIISMFSPRILRLSGAFMSVLLLGGTMNLAIAAKCDLREGATESQGREGFCKFNSEKRAFDGIPSVQAACLTRMVKQGGHIGGETITAFLRNLIDSSAPPKIDVLEEYLEKLGIEQSEVGGAIPKPITANYFIIHDTSSPNCSVKGVSASKCPTLGEFPPNRDEAGWSVNKNFDGHPQKAPNRVAHVFNSRVGESITEADFALHLPTTKFETCVDKSAKIGLFIGIENIQPRISVPPIPPKGKKVNDLDAPTPGFTSKQYDRLALLYLVASVRRDKWLVPAFHAIVDNQYADGHDDPQHFDMSAFSSALEKHVDALKAQ